MRQALCVAAVLIACPSSALHHATVLRRPCARPLPVQAATRRAAVNLALSGKVTIEQKKIVLNAAEWDSLGRPGIVRVRLQQQQVDTCATSDT